LDLLKKEGLIMCKIQAISISFLLSITYAMTAMEQQSSTPTATTTATSENTAASTPANSTHQPAIASQLTDIFESVATIFQNAHNPQTVSTNVTNILTNLVGIASEFSQHKDLPKNSTTEETTRWVNELDPAVKTSLHDTILTSIQTNPSTQPAA
jgi:hypothetical protein